MLCGKAVITERVTPFERHVPPKSSKEDKNVPAKGVEAKKETAELSVCLYPPNKEKGIKPKTFD